MRDRPPQGCQLDQNPPPPPLDRTGKPERLASQKDAHTPQQKTPQIEESTQRPLEQGYSDFTQEEYEELLAQAPDISNIPIKTYLTKVWEDLEQSNPEHKARRWRSFYEDVVHPAYLEQLEKEKRVEQQAKKTPETLVVDVTIPQSREIEPKDPNGEATSHIVIHSEDGSTTHRREPEISHQHASKGQSVPDTEDQECIEANQMLDGANESKMSQAEQDSLDSSRKRQRGGKIDSPSSHEEYLSPKRKKVRLQSSQPPLKTSTPPKTSTPSESFSPNTISQIINLSSEGEGEDAGGARIGEAEKARVRSHNSSLDEVAGSAVTIRTPRKKVGSADLNDNRRRKTTSEQHIMVDETEKELVDSEESSDSHSSFDPVTSSAMARAMVGNRPTSANDSTQNTPTSSSQSERPESARAAFERLRDEYENSFEVSFDPRTPTKRQQTRIEKASPSKSPLSALRNSKEVGSSRIQGTVKSFGALPSSMGGSQALSQRFDEQRLNKKVEYPCIQDGATNVQIQQSALFNALTKDREILSKDTVTTTNGRSNSQSDQGLTDIPRIDHDNNSEEKNEDESTDEDDYEYAQGSFDRAESQALSDTGTQIFFDAQTQQPDLELIEPNGWFNEPQKPGADKHSDFRDEDVQKKISVARKNHQADPKQDVYVDVDPDTDDEESFTTNRDQTSTPRDRQVTVDTQAIFDSDALEGSDLHLPSLNEFLSQPAPSSSPPITSSPQQEEQSESAHDSQTELSDMDKWIREMVEEGHDWDLVVEAMRVTCFDTDLVLQILPSLESGEGVPQDVQGVWTEEDDEQLEGGDGRCLKRLDRKHGWTLMDERMDFLRRWREGQNEASEV